MYRKAIVGMADQNIPNGHKYVCIPKFFVLVMQIPIPPGNPDSKPIAFLTNRAFCRFFKCTCYQWLSTITVVILISRYSLYRYTISLECPGKCSSRYFSGLGYRIVGGGGLRCTVHSRNSSLGKIPFKQDMLG
jgi:hypothetical protein